MATLFSSATPSSRSASTRRGQSITVDFIISISIFLLLLAIAYNFWQNDLQRMDDTVTALRAQEAARRGLMALVESPGFPSNWAALNMTPDNSSLLGLGAASAYGQLDAYKLTRLGTLFNNSTYYNNTLLKMGLSPFQSDVRVAYLNGTNISVMGAAPTGASDVVWASEQRLAYYQNETVLVRVRVWTVTPA